MNDEPKTVSDVLTVALILISSFIRGIVTWPFRMLFVILAVPNFKIIYKSGHVERIFLKSIEVDNHFKKIRWQSSGACKNPLNIGLDNIESIYQIY